MSDPAVAVLMLCLFVLTILIGFPICFTLVAMGVIFGYYAYWDPERMGLWVADGPLDVIEALSSNRVFDLLVNQTYSVMANDVLTAVPLFLFMGYIVERANIVDRLFHTLYIATKRLPGSMAVAALATCALFATATGIVGAVVTLMGLLAYPAMLKARYDVPFASGVICAGGCLGILIPPSVMLIVYAATSTISVVKLYAAAMLPGFLLAGLYIVYVVGRSILNPKIAPKPRAEDIPDVTRGQLFIMMLVSFFPLAGLILAVLGSILFGLATPSEAASMGALGGIVLAVSYRLGDIRNGIIKPDWTHAPVGPYDDWLRAIGFGGITTLVIATAYVTIHFLLRKLVGIAMPEEPHFIIQPGLAVALTAIFAVVGRSMGPGAPVVGYLWPEVPALRRAYEFAGKGAIIGLGFGALYMAMFSVLGFNRVFDKHVISPYGFDIGLLLGMAAYFCWKVNDQEKLRESVYLATRTSAMVCWLFVGSWTFASVFSYLGGQQLIEEFVLSLELSPVMFLIMSQVIIFLLGWPLEWSEIIIIFIPIFLPMLAHFDVDPIFFGILVALNLQTAFLSPPMAMAAYYLKGIAPPHVTLVHIFKGVMPFMSMIFLAMLLVYVFPEIVLWLPGVLYGR